MEKVKSKNVLPRELIYIGCCAGYYIKAEHIFSDCLLYKCMHNAWDYRQSQRLKNVLAQFHYTEHQNINKKNKQLGKKECQSYKTQSTKHSI